MRTGENIRKRKNGRWEARIYDIHTKKYHSIYAKTYQEVKERKNEYIKSKEQPLVTSPETIETCFLSWLNDIKPLVKQSTFAKYYDIAHNHIINHLGAIKLNNLKQEDKSVKSLRTIPLQQLLIEKLEPLQQKTDMYFLTSTPHYMEPRAYQKKYEEILKNCHIEYINFHALRHTFATKSMECNMDIKSLSEILGHYDVKFTMSQYVHSSFEHKKSQLEKLTQIL
ncbi:MAG: tyrosine-type recombinase/integrase [Lachnospiraceae bacterium]|nr:tyrosine-type recombinase/integrase [Lachnospiraceae bacterium]